MKTTLRRNGTKMVTMQIKHYIGRDDMIAFVASQLNGGYTEDEIGDARKIEKDLRLQLEQNAEGFLYWADHLYDKSRDAVEAQATEIVDRLFPEFDHQNYPGNNAA